jgi:hypothetical protein
VNVIERQHQEEDQILDKTSDKKQDTSIELQFSKIAAPCLNIKTRHVPGNMYKVIVNNIMIYGYISMWR